MYKMLTRRKFLKLAAVSGPLVNSMAHASSHSSDGVNIGLQLWTVRKQIAEDPVATLKLISELGYSTVEVDDLDQLTDLKPILDDLGLVIGGLNISTDLITAADPSKGNLELAIEIAMKENIDYLIINSPLEYFTLASPNTPGHTPTDFLTFYHGFAADITRAGTLTNNANITLAFHIHSCEFQPLDNTTPLTILMDEVDPQLLKFEIDTFWISMAGQDPATFIEANKHRCISLHLKDRNPRVKDSYNTIEVVRNFPGASLPVGDGEIDFKSVLNVAREAGIKKWFVEQDHFTESPQISLRKSYAEVQRILSL